MQNLPIGIQDFRKIRENDYLYVDKTELLYQLTLNNYYFLSRPRRFGKSLLLSTLKELFSGSQELFKGLWIEDKWNWATSHPVIHLKTSSIDYQRLGLYAALSKEMGEIATELSIVLKEIDLKDRFKELIKKAAKDKKVVILVDEYDKPIIDYLGDSDKIKENKAVLKEFYSVIKDADPYIRFLFITGVSKFTKVSIFSDLNNLEDISLSSYMNDVVGITQKEMEDNFKPFLTETAENLNETPEKLLNDIRNWYNGYNWLGKNTLYNPFSLLSFFKKKQFQNFWFETGTPTFLIEEVTKRRKFNFSEVQSGYSGLSDFNTDNLSPTTLLFQTGYLTIKEYNPKFQMYTLGYPNEEVQSSLLQHLIGAYRFENASESTPLVVQMYNALHEKDVEKNIEEFVNIINTAFATIPYDLWRGATELHYHALVHLTFSLLGTYMQSEVHSAKGRCDAIVQTPQYIYAFEFKLDESAEIALQQIEDKGYLTPFNQHNQEKIAVGINFSSEEKCVADFKIKE